MITVPQREKERRKKKIKEGEREMGVRDKKREHGSSCISQRRGFWPASTTEQNVQVPRQR